MSFRKIDKIIGQFPKIRRLLVKILEFREFKVVKVYYDYSSEKNHGGQSLSSLGTQGKTLAIDAQCLLTATRERGIGKYTWNLVSEITSLRSDLRVVLLVPNIFSFKKIRELVSKVEESGFENLEIQRIDVFGGKSRISLNHAQDCIKKFCQELAPDAILLPSNFEHPRDAIPFPHKIEIPLFGIYYDLIPLTYSSSLLFSRFRKSLFNWQLRRLVQLDPILAISDFSRRILLEQSPADTYVRTIWGGPGLRPNLDVCASQGFDSRHGIFVVGAETPHKNLPTLIQAYSLLPKETKNTHPLTIAGIRSEGYRNFLKRRASKAHISLNLPMYLSETELANLYSDSRLVVIPSTIEGLSLPILEAWLHNCVALGGEGTVAEEIIGDERALFDVRNAVDMSAKIELFLNSKDLWEEAHLASTNRMELFTWQRSALIVSEELERIWSQ